MKKKSDRLCIADATLCDLGLTARLLRSSLFLSSSVLLRPSYFPFLLLSAVSSSADVLRCLLYVMTYRSPRAPLCLFQLKASMYLCL